MEEKYIHYTFYGSVQQETYLLWGNDGSQVSAYLRKELRMSRN